MPAFALLLLLSALPAAAQGLRVDETMVGGPRSGKPVELYLPQGAAPTAAVVVLHGCDGVGPHTANGPTASRNGVTPRC